MDGFFIAHAGGQFGVALPFTDPVQRHVDRRAAQRIAQRQPRRHRARNVRHIVQLWLLLGFKAAPQLRQASLARVSTQAVLLQRSHDFFAGLQCFSCLALGGLGRRLHRVQLTAKNATVQVF